MRERELCEKSLLDLLPYKSDVRLYDVDLRSFSWTPLSIKPPALTQIAQATYNL